VEKKDPKQIEIHTIGLDLLKNIMAKKQITTNHVNQRKDD